MSVKRPQTYCFAEQKYGMYIERYRVILLYGKITIRHIGIMIYVYNLHIYQTRIFVILFVKKIILGFQLEIDNN